MQYMLYRELVHKVGRTSHEVSSIIISYNLYRAMFVGVHPSSSKAKTSKEDNTTIGPHNLCFPTISLLVPYTLPCSSAC